ncbi:MmcQ/YjbR family DNA-binding protein [Permianibacter sp. IMCC34836]|nr:MmcQ/YjbR family DNA-binding protein [Permianibacter fluminis]
MNQTANTRLRTAIAQLALQLPGVSSDIKWGSVLVYSVANKMFCCLTSDTEINAEAESAARNALRISVKVSPERFLEWTDQPGIIPAPYLAKHHWVSLEPACTLSQADVLNMIEQSYRLVRAKLPRKTQAALAATS